jgi:hypothetical protein
MVVARFLALERQLQWFGPELGVPRDTARGARPRASDHDGDGDLHHRDGRLGSS